MKELTEKEAYAVKYILKINGLIYREKKDRDGLIEIIVYALDDD